MQMVAYLDGSKMRIPWATALVFVVSVSAIVVLIVSGHIAADLVPVLVAIVPGLLSTSWLTERVVKQTSNGYTKVALKQAITELAEDPGHPEVAIIKNPDPDPTPKAKI
jgi:hypothetical protein